MLDRIAKHFGLKSMRTIAETISLLKKELYGKNLVVIIDNVHLLSRQAVAALEKMPFVIVASANHEMGCLRFREKIKLRRRTYVESKAIAKGFMEIPDYLADYIARRGNGIPGRIRTMIEDVRVALELGEIELDDKNQTISYMDSIKLPSYGKTDKGYILLALASFLLCLRYIFYRYDLYDAGYMVAIFAYLIYASQRIRKARRN